MSDNLQVDTHQIREASRQADQKAQAIRDELRRLDSTIGQELLVDGWKGKAASAYDESWLEWKHGAETVAAALEDSSVQLALTADAYDATEASNHSQIASILDWGPQ
ncbi:WXG100 family type VII secretion target [Rhodococcus sp. BP22]|uniref:WXG100 family type VII secretion target n=1 Tax=Rhodococcus sp. BP22 TaxID=2758566 RepID=UPI0021BD764F|nr:WXG100 family type VII secretion target [Rhodococcus sp. BP22]